MTIEQLNYLLRKELYAIKNHKDNIDRIKKEYFDSNYGLKEGDKIIYKCYGFERTYVVTKNLIITDEDWSYLEETEKNTITLITCVENEPMYRRCIQGKEI